MVEMNENLQKLAADFAQGRNAFAGKFIFEYSYIAPACALVAATKNAQTDVTKIKECKKIIQREFSVFSEVRGMAMMFIASMLALRDDPEVFVKDLHATYTNLRKEFMASPFLPLAAYMIAEQISPVKRDEVVERSKAVYKLMKKEHWVLTSSEDCTYAVMLAMSGMREEQIIEKTSGYYDILKKLFKWHPNHVQTMSHVLAMTDGYDESKCQKIRDIFDALKKRKTTFGTEYELPTLSILAMLDEDTDTIADKIVAVDKYLKSCRGFGFWGVGSRQRRMYAGILVAIDGLGGESSTALCNTAMTSVINIIIAIEIAICCSVIASTTRSSSSSS